MEQKNVLLAVILSIAVLYGYSYLFPPPQKPATTTTAITQQSAAVSAPAISPAQVKPMEQVAQPARDIVVETDLYTAVFTTAGAGLKKLSLKNYKDVAGPGGHEIVLVNEESAQNYSLLSESKEFGIAPSALYSVSAGSLRLAGSTKGSLQFLTTTPTGVVYKKTYTFSGDSYSIDLLQDLQNPGTASISGSLHLVETNRAEPHPDDKRYEVHGPVTLAGDKVSADKLTDLDKAAKKYDKGISWTAFGDKYFMNAVLSANNSIAAVNLLKSSPVYLKRDIVSPAVTIAPGQSAAFDYKIYYGPKDLEILKKQGSRLEEVIDFGWFSVLAKPLIYTLKYFYRYTHNYGIAIIIITVILKLLFFPLTHKSYKSMKEMQKLQPKMTALKEKFKNDRDAMNKAVMELYKTHKVNPLGGCLPMVIQIPVFFALYKALMFSIELRHAPFMFWIQDLSAKDPLYITPVIMGVTMFIQQKMTPSNMDPVQAKMMLALPVVFTFMFLSFPSGLVLYWLINNILTIAQQTYINKSLPA
jgi:YidC/Oxa1 family membrane protein insertase